MQSNACHAPFISRVNVYLQAKCVLAPIISDYSSASKYLLARTHNVVLEWHGIIKNFKNNQVTDFVRII